MEKWPKLPSFRVASVHEVSHLIGFCGADHGHIESDHRILIEFRQRLTPDYYPLSGFWTRTIRVRCFGMGSLPMDSAYLLQAWWSRRGLCLKLVCPARDYVGKDWEKANSFKSLSEVMELQLRTPAQSRL